MHTKRSHEGTELSRSDGAPHGGKRVKNTEYEQPQRPSTSDALACLARLLQSSGLTPVPQSDTAAQVQQVVQRSRLPEQLWLCLAELNTLLHPQDLAPSSSSTTVTSYHSFTRASKATVYYAYLATLGLDAMVAGLPDDSLMLAPPPGAPLHASLLCYILDCVCRYLHDARVARYALAVPDLLRPWQRHWGFNAQSLQVLEVQVFHRAQLEPAVTLYIPCA